MDKKTDARIIQLLKNKKDLSFSLKKVSLESLLDAKKLFSIKEPGSLSQEKGGLNGCGEALFQDDFIEKLKLDLSLSKSSFDFFGQFCLI